METISIQDILKTNLGQDGETYYSKRSENAKRQLVVTAVLELMKAEALGGTDSGSLYTNFCHFEAFITKITNALESNNK